MSPLLALAPIALALAAAPSTPTSTAAAATLPEPSASPSVAAPAKVTIKLATLVPDGSIWDKGFRRMGSEWKRDTDGRVKLKMYAGGVAGDEPDMLRKMRIGQLNAASITVAGLGQIDPAFKIFEIPMFFESHEELVHVLSEMEPLLKKRLLDKGYVLLHWGNAGWVHLFSMEPVRTPDDLRKQKLFTWAGDNNMLGWWKENKFQIVPLAATDIPTGLQTGLIEVVPAPPISALAFQWFRSTPYMLEVGMAPFIGATVISKKTWKKISEADRAILESSAAKLEAELDREVPKQEAEAIAEMQKRGMTVIEGAGGNAPWRPFAKSFADRMKQGVVPADVCEEAERLRDAYRAKRGSSD